MAKGVLQYLIQVHLGGPVHRPACQLGQLADRTGASPLLRPGWMLTWWRAFRATSLSWSASFADRSPLASDVARSPSLPECRHETRNAPTAVSRRPHFPDGPLNTPEQEAQ
jgi:hypothetical protein